MQFIDETKIHLQAGNGGNGASSFRREKFISHGGPDGGDGGRGGNVVVVADQSISTLYAYRRARLLRAVDGTAGGPNQRRGASGADLEIRVPAGSVVWAVGAPDQLLADLDEDGKQAVIAYGGRGGWGNRRFATPTRQAPHFAQSGAEGQHVAIRIELKLLADVGIVGLPNAGKSTLLRAWSRATPRVAPYPFTTLEPELGVVDMGFEAFVAADMPGLIEGASEGIGLGHEFLRHIERTQVLVHVLDLTRDDPLADYALINAELAAFGHGLDRKPQLLALNKIDLPDGRAQLELLQPEFERLDVPWMVISGASGEGTADLAKAAYGLLQRARVQTRPTASPLPVLAPEPRQRRLEVQVGADGVVEVHGRTPEWLAATLNVEEREPRHELFERLRRMGLGRALARAGAEPGDQIRIGGVMVEWEG